MTLRSVKKPSATPNKLVILHIYKDFHIYNALFGTLLLLARHNDYSKIDLRLCIFNYRRSPWGDEFETLGGKIIDLDARWSQSPFITFKLIKCLRREQPNIVQTHELKANLYGRLAALWAGVPVIIGTLHTLKDTAPSPLRRLRDRIFHPLSAWLDRRSDCVVTTSDAVRREWDPSMQSPLYRTIYPPFTSHRSAAETRFPLPLSDSELFRIGVVARLSEEKGLPLLLAAMRSVLTDLPKAALFIAGDGRMRSDLETLTTRLGLFSRVHFLGHIGDVPAFLSKLDLYVQPSRSDSLPLAVMEALAAGLPVIATRVGGFPEIVTDGTNGRLVPPNDVEALADAILALGRNVDERRRLAQAGRETMRQRFQVPEFLHEMDCLYTELAAKMADSQSADLGRA